MKTKTTKKTAMEILMEELDMVALTNCEVCDGLGVTQPHGNVKCPVCNGRGTTEEYDCDADGKIIRK